MTTAPSPRPAGVTAPAPRVTAGTHPLQPQRGASCRGDTHTPPTGTPGSPPDGAGEVLVVLADPQAHLPLLGREGRHRSVQDALQFCKGSQPSLGLLAAAWLGGRQTPPGETTGVGTCPQAPVHTHRRCSTEPELDCQLRAGVGSATVTSVPFSVAAINDRGGHRWGGAGGTNLCLGLTFAMNLKGSKK